ncbi:hypothetical protein AGMMS50293_07330 [Spirochaetia bacterium]|nr:hypothetical protein AGMMS50293_07330 [Spirochaetia bacterium]
MKKAILVGVLVCMIPVFGFSQSRRGGGYSDDAWKNNWLYLGARIGGSPNFYKPAEEFKDLGVDSLEGSFGFNLAAQIAVQFVDLFAVQAELMYTHDKGSYKEGGYELNASYDSLLIPILAKLTFRPNNFLIAPFAGIYFTIPLGEIEVKESLSGYGSDSEKYEFETSAGFMIGASFGIKVGPGVLFADLRYAGDFTDTKIKDGGQSIEYFTRSKLPITIGYEIGLMSKGGSSGGGGRRY